MNKAYKFRIYPTNEQKVLLARTFGCVRFVYNKMLAEKQAHYEETGKPLRITPAKYKPEHEWLREVDSLALANAQLNLETAFRNFFRDKTAGYPKFKSRHKDHDSYTTNMVNGNIVLEEGRLKLPKAGKVNIRRHRMIPDGYRLKSVTVSKAPSGKYYAAIMYKYEEDIKPVAPVNVVGLDFSMRDLYVSSDGEYANYPRFYRRSQEKLTREQWKLSRKAKGGRNREKQRIKVAKLHEHVANQRKDFLHKQSRRIANAYDAVCVEDLNMRGMSQALNFGKSVYDNGWGMFSGFLGYKLKGQGRQLVKTDKWFPSSKMCSCCGAVKGDMPLSERVFRCDCGFVCDRDVNAAINIRNEGIRLLSQPYSKPWDARG